MSSCRVLAEDTIAVVAPPNNGAGPLWCYGSRVLARVGDVVFAVVPETGADVPPLCNTRWVLYRRPDGGAWERVQAGAAFDEREPCPLARTPDGRLLLSVNPARERFAPMADGRQGARCEPQLLRFGDDPAAPPTAMLPAWDQPYFTSEHSYRAFAADPVSGSLLLTNQVPVDGEHLHAYCYDDGDSRPAARGLLRFPMRGCYQQVAVRGAAVYVMAISDEEEPNPAWRAHKEAVTGQHWDYDFRQLFFTWTPDITAVPFSPILTVASRDETAGFISNLDLWVDADGDAHLLYLEKNVWHPYMRDRFFPGLPLSTALQYARVRRGRVVHRETLLQATERLTPGAVGSMDAPEPRWATFHATPDGRLFAIWYQAGEEEGNYLRQIFPAAGTTERLPLAQPLATLFAAGERNGCAPSFTIDLYGTPPGDGLRVCYAQVALAE